MPGPGDLSPILDRAVAQPEAWLLLLAVVAPAVAGMATFLLPRALTGTRSVVSLVGPLVSLVLIGVFLAQNGVDHGRVAIPWVPALNLDFAFHADALGAFFALLVAGIGCLICLYGRAYLGDEPHDVAKFYPLITAFMTAMLGLVLSDDILLMLLFWELTSVTSFLLIGWDPWDKKAVKNALQAFFTTGFGGLVMFGGLVWLAVLTGAWSFTELSPVAETPFVLGAFALTYVGVAAKSAQWPLHYWLPGAMAAPTPISAYLHSAAMVKAGIYLLARLWPDLSVLDAWPWVVVGFGSVTMVLGAWIALQRDILKQILAYTTISQLGLLACAFGLAGIAYKGEPNVVWGNTQILNHALYKAALFMLAGGVTHAFGMKALSQMSGSWHAGGERRLYAVLFLLAMIALAAIPGTLSFFAKEAFLYQVWHAWEATRSPMPLLLLVGTLFVSVCNVALLVRFAQTFFAPYVRPEPAVPHNDAAGAPHPTHESHHDVAFWHHLLWVPAALLIALQFVGGIVGPPVVRLFAHVEATPYYLSADAFSLIYVVLNPSVPLLVSLLGIGLGVLLGLSGVWRGFRGDVHDGIFPAAYSGILGGGRSVFGVIQTGHVRTYALVILAAFAALLAYAATVGGTPLKLLTLPADSWRAAQANGSALPSLVATPGSSLLPALLVTCAVVLVLVRDRVVRVLVLGTVGFAMTGIFYLYAAPDLALTQLSVEIVSLVLFLLVLNLLPDQNIGQRRVVLPRLVVGLAVGLVAFVGTLAASSGDRPPRTVGPVADLPDLTIGEFLLRNSYYGNDLTAVDASRVGTGVVDRGDGHLTGFGSTLESAGTAGQVAVHKGGGGGNVVNVTLVDFRGFDTYGEVAVLGLAAMGVWTLLRRPPGRDDAGGTDNRDAPYAHAFDVPPAERPRGDHPVRSELIASPLLKTAARLLLPLALVFSAYMFFKGHQTPGGGFVGGLAAAVALVVFRMCFGSRELYALLPVRERTMIGLGLLCATVAAAVPLLLGLPLLTSNNGYLPLPGGGTYHWATVLVFDLGVFLIVVGSIVGMIDALARELE